jgi:glucosylceramidase
MSKKIIAGFLTVALVLAVFPISTTAVGPTVEVWVSQVNSTNTGMLKGLEKQSDLQFNDDNGTRISNLIAVNENNTYQVMDGFGASITEASAYLYQNILSSSQKSSLMNALFDK